METNVGIQKAKRKLYMKVFERIKDSTGGTSCKSTWTLFPVERTNNIKIKMTCHTVIGDGCNWEGTSLAIACSVSQSGIHQVLSASSDGMFKWRSLVKKEHFIERIVLLRVIYSLCYYNWEGW